MCNAAELMMTLLMLCLNLNAEEDPQKRDPVFQGQTHHSELMCQTLSPKQTTNDKDKTIKTQHSLYRKSLKQGSAPRSRKNYDDFLSAIHVEFGNPNVGKIQVEAATEISPKLY